MRSVSNGERRRRKSSCSQQTVIDLCKHAPAESCSSIFFYYPFHRLLHARSWRFFLNSGCCLPWWKLVCSSQSLAVSASFACCTATTPWFRTPAWPKKLSANDVSAFSLVETVRLRSGEWLQWKPRENGLALKTASSNGYQTLRKIREIAFHMIHPL